MPDLRPCGSRCRGSLQSALEIQVSDNNQAQSSRAQSLPLFTKVVTSEDVRTEVHTRVFDKVSHYTLANDVFSVSTFQPSEYNTGVRRNPGGHLVQQSHTEVTVQCSNGLRSTPLRAPAQHCL